MNFSFSTSPPPHGWSDPATIQVVWTIIQGFGTLVLGAVGVFIARQNVAIGGQNIEIMKQNAAIAGRGLAVTEQQSRLDHYPRRAEVYEAVTDFLDLCEREGSVEWSHIEEFDKRTRSAAFSLYPSARDFLKAVRASTILLHVSRQGMEGKSRNDPKRLEFVSLNEKAQAEIKEHVARVDDVFDPYLEFRPTRPPESVSLPSS